MNMTKQKKDQETLKVEGNVGELSVPFSATHLVENINRYFESSAKKILALESNKKKEIGKRKQILEFTNYLDLIDYIQDYPKHKKNLILVSEEKSKAFRISGEISEIMIEIYPVPAYKESVRCVVLEDLSLQSYDSLAGIVPELIGREFLFIAVASSIEVLYSLPPSFLHICKVFDLETSKFLDTSGKAKKEQQTASNQKANIFRYKEGHWEITFENKTIYPTDSKGLKYISYALSHPRKEFYNFRLYQLVSGQLTGNVKNEQSLDAELKPTSGTKITTEKEDKQDNFQKQEEMFCSITCSRPNSDRIDSQIKTV
ncbi:MAG: hypothetical protein GY928_32655 [Colwellia sp.]|nr:hypothetical protein [Colwellia sp.]